ncbi:GGDEF domain-containing protein [Oceanithermus sp.]
MIGLAGSAVSLTVAAISGYPLLSSSPTATALSPLYWGLAAMIGYGHYALTRLLQERYQQLQAMALSDPLTGLGNRRALEQDFPRYQHLAVREGKRLVLTLWDINDLKKLNDIHGHSFGDSILKKFARAVTSTARHSDPFYRIGGDEFAGLHIGIDNPNELIKRIREKTPWVSAGWTDATNLDFEEAYKKADQNMYTDKSTKPGDPTVFDVEQ